MTRLLMASASVSLLVALAASPAMAGNTTPVCVPSGVSAQTGILPNTSSSQQKSDANFECTDGIDPKVANCAVSWGLTAIPAYACDPSLTPPLSTGWA
jgi:hypothetical protein